MAGRPTRYSDELAQTFLERVADGRSVRSVCRDEDMPDRETIRRWSRNDAEFAANIARAREESQDWSIDECRDIAMNATPEDWLVAQLQIKTLQWEAGKRAPKKFGDKQHVEHSGSVTLENLVTGSHGE